MKRARDDAFEIGEEAEKLIRFALQNAIGPNGERWGTIPLSLAAAVGAALLSGAEGKAILPDIMAAARGKTELFEVKYKTTDSLRRVSGERETGISSRHFANYLQCKAATGLPVTLVFIHQVQDEILAQEVDVLRRYARTANDDGTLKAFGEPMTFFPTHAMRRWASLSSALESARGGGLELHRIRAESRSIPMPVARARELAMGVFGYADDDDAPQPDDAKAMRLIREHDFTLEPKGVWLSTSGNTFAIRRFLSRWVSLKSDAAVEFSQASAARWERRQHTALEVQCRLGRVLEPEPSTVAMLEREAAAE